MEKIKALENANENQEQNQERHQEQNKNSFIYKQKQEFKRFQKKFVLSTNDERKKEPNENQNQSQKYNGRTQRRRSSSKA